MRAEVIRLACERPADCDVPLARWSSPELAREAVARGICEQISGVTVWRWLSQDAIKPWQHRSWIFPRDRQFTAQERRRVRRLPHQQGRLPRLPGRAGQRLADRDRRHRRRLCRHLVRDRMDITGARWGLKGAEAILKLRALISNDEYWRYHLAQEHQRVHQSRYATQST